MMMKPSFTGYILDKLTTLKPITDRIFGIGATAQWSCAAQAIDWAATRVCVLDVLERTFTGHDSAGVQRTLLF